MKTNHISIIGSGKWGLSLAATLSNHKRSILIWSRTKDSVDEINVFHKSTAYLGDYILPIQVKATMDLAYCCQYSDVILLSLPIVYLVPVLEEMATFSLHKKQFILTSKGLYKGKTISTIMESLGLLHVNQLSVLSGPSFASELLEHKKTAMVLASKQSISSLEIIQRLFTSADLRIYLSTDVEGVEYCGALKNVYAIASGIIAGANLGDNAQAALLTRSIHELRGVMIQLHFQESTLYGLAGIGDLFLTCSSKQSRNYRFGYAIGQCQSVEEVKKTFHETIEGLSTLDEIYQLSKKMNLQTPIMISLYQLIYESRNLHEIIDEIMLRNRVMEL
ncbi:MAG: NAD(P)H-dependent glycerol-3-phosphate dehydrogenase [bacterium]|nr:NAD(P)H-dependent glycerol-3-phosphate dehydrogenase [bacterium]